MNRLRAKANRPAVAAPAKAIATPTLPVAPKRAVTAGHAVALREAEANHAATSHRPGRQAAPQSSRGGGMSLPPQVRAELEVATGANLSTVRVHDNADADREARALHARAFARGEDIVFAAGEFRPNTSDGRELIAHEVAHVLQQRREGVVRIDRQPQVSPQAAFRDDVRAALRSTMTTALTDKQAFWDLINQTHRLDKSLLDLEISVTANDQKTFVDYFALAVARIGEASATIELAGQDHVETVDWDSANKLLSMQLGSPSLSQYGLPTSFGTDLFLDYGADTLTRYLVDAADALFVAYTQFDPNTSGQLANLLANAIDQQVTGMVADIAGALQWGVTRWGDPFGLLELELEGAIYKLLEAREELKKATTNDARAAAGKKINFLARTIIVIDANLVPADERKERREKGERAKTIGESDFGSVSGVVEAARAYAPSEEQTLQYRGNQLSELGGRSAVVQSPLFLPLQGVMPIPGTQLQTGVAGKEAYPHYSDQVAVDALKALVAQANTEVAEVESLRKQVVPDRVVDLVNFGVVYKRWFSFYSSEARQNDPAWRFINQLYRGGIMSFAAMGGPSGWLGRGFVTQAVGSVMPVGMTNAKSFQAEVARIKFERQEHTSGEVVGSSGGGSGVKYETAELPTGSSEPLSAAGEASARDTAVSEQSQESRQAFTSIYSMPAQDMIAAASQLGRYHGAPGETRFWDPHDLQKDRTGFKTNWSYLMDTEVFTQAFDTKVVHEHKVMRDEIARFLVARTQALQTHGATHTVRDEFAQSVVELESAEATAEARYVRGEDAKTTNPELESLKAQLRAAKTALEQSSPEALIGSLVRLMDDYFKYADPANRVMAVLIIGIYEDELTEELMSGFNMKAIMWAIGIAAGIAAVLWVLSQLGPLGQLAAAVIQRTLHKIGLSVNIASVITIGQWAINAGMASSFGEAERWAYVGADVAAEISQLMRDYALAQAQKGLKWAWNWKFKTPPTNPKDLGVDIRDTFGNDPAGRQMLDEIDGAIRKSLDAGDTGVMTKDSIEFLKSADPDAYARLARDYPNVFKDVITPRADLRAGSAAADMHTLVQAGIDPKIAGRVNIVEVPGDSVRIKVKNGMLEIEVGRKAPTDAAGQAVLEGHLGAIKRLSRYVGPVGQVRHMLAKLGAAIGFLTIHTKGGEAAEEIAKLTNIRNRLQKLRTESEAKLGKWADEPTKLSDADLDAEIAKIQKQIDGYALELLDTSVGKGYIAAEGNFAAIEKAGILGKPPNVQELEALGYRVDKNGIIYRPKGAGATMEPLQVRNGVVEIGDFESPAAVQARVRESLPTTKQTDFDTMVATAPKGTKVRLVEGVHDTGATWKEVFGSPTSVRGKALRQQLRDILTVDGGLSGEKADELINGLLERSDTIKVVIGTDPVRTAADYRSRAGTTGDDIAHHFDPLYLGGGHKLIANLPTGAHDKIHRFFDELTLPSTARPGGVKLQPGTLQSAVRANVKPAVVIVDEPSGINDPSGVDKPSGSVRYKLFNEDWNWNK